jgi:hypothetical protein
MAATCPIPEGMELPPDIEPGGTFEALATVALNDDGTLSIKELDGNPLPDYEEEKEAPDEGGFMESVTSQMQ